jgi:hypothetical protein
MTSIFTMPLRIIERVAIYSLDAIAWTLETWLDAVSSFDRRVFAREEPPPPPMSYRVPDQEPDLEDLDGYSRTHSSP